MPHRLLVVALALCALVAPPTAAAQTTIDLVVNDIDAFWAQQFALLPCPCRRPGLEWGPCGCRSAFRE